jgi:hypothetical protein
MVAKTSLDTWVQAAAALFTALTAAAALAAARQVKAASDEERRLRMLAHLKVVHDLVSELALINPTILGVGKARSSAFAERSTSSSPVCQSASTWLSPIC